MCEDQTMSEFGKIMEYVRAYPLRPSSRRDPTENDLRDFEENLGCPLPSDYRRFVTRYGRHGLSAVPRFTLGEPSPFKQPACISQFFGFGTDSLAGLVEATMDTYAGRVPDSTIPIGRDPGGNLILLGIDGYDFGRVYFWDQSFREFTGNLESQAQSMAARNALVQTGTKRPRFENVYLVAESFAAFLGMLEPDPAYAE
jgi:hypothetical protein